jgi:predicted permease
MPFSIRPRVRRAFRIALRRRDLTEEEIDDELAFHLESRIEQLMAGGLTREDAVREARRRFGLAWPDVVIALYDAGRRREERLAMRERLGAWWLDVNYALRTLRRQRAFAFVVIATFALGIGANATMFGVIDRLLLQPPAGVGDAGSLGVATLTDPGLNPSGVSNLSYPLATALRSDSTVFSDVAAATTPSTYTLGRGPGAEEIVAVLTSGSYFTTLRARAAIGRVFGPDDDRDVSPGPIVLSNGFWSRRFGGDLNAIGKVIQIGPSAFTVVGVAERGFAGVNPRRVDAWIPIASAGKLKQTGSRWTSDWGSYWITTFTRLRPGVRPDVASAHATAAYITGRVTSGEETQQWATETREHIELRSVLPSEQLRNEPEARIATLLVAVTVVVLLIGCANVTNLLIARGTERRREIAVRLALGVSRRRLVRLLFMETALLATVGGAVALGVAVVGVRLLRATLLADFVWTDAIIDSRLVVATLGLVTLTSLLAGIAPALSASRPNVTETLKTSGREGSVHRSRVVAVLIVVQAALSVMLLVGAGLFVTSLRNVAALRLGYEPQNVIAASMDLGMLGYKDADRLALFRTMRDRVAALPGVTSVAVSSTHPLHGRAFASWGIRVPGRDSLPQAKTGGPYDITVGGDYFSTLGLRIVDGRPITAADVTADARVTVLSEPMARAYWPGESAVGRCVYIADSTCTTVIGVAADARERISRTLDRFLIYMPATPRWAVPTSVLLVRTGGNDPHRLLDSIRRTVQGSAPNLPYADVQPLAGLLANQARPWRMGATLFGIFGGLAVVIAVLGLYSAVSYSVTQRRHEFGVRMTLGAQVGDVVRLVMSQGVRASVLGIAIGSISALLTGRFVADLLFDTSALDPFVFTVVGGIMLSVSSAATLVPAWRAARVDPVIALRAD